ncbi:MAG: DUF1439 domain-containing protein [Gammaproteobacteria bacterium]|nr:DUF1439 domain-containing protein [Gammaproteobacteria bacterium]
MIRVILFINLLTLSGIANAFTLEFTEAEVQEKISAMMPLERKKLFLTMIIRDPIVKFLKNPDKVSVMANIEASVPGGMTGTGNVNIVGSLSYNKEEGSFYLKDPIINEMHIDKIQNKYQSTIKDLAQKVVVNVMSTRSVYKLRDDNVKHKLAKSTLNSISVSNQKLIVEFNLF